MIDELVRRRLKEVLDRESADAPAPGINARQIAAAVIASRASEVGRARIYSLVGGSAAVLAAAAAVFLIVQRERPDASGTRPLAAVSVPGAQGGAAPPTGPSVAPDATGAACTAQALAPDMPRLFARRADGRHVLDLGSRALLVASAEAVITPDRLDACTTRIRLESGTLAVHARDLGGGELRVSTPLADAIVHGTVFSVTVAAGWTDVSVLEGEVLVLRRSGAQAVAVAGKRVTVRPDGEIEGLSVAPAERESVEAALGMGVAGTATEIAGGSAPDRGDRAGARDRDLALLPSLEGPLGVTPDALVLRANDLRGAHDYEGARRLYRGVGAMAGPTADAAWLALARMELELRRLPAARDALRTRESRFQSSGLEPEARWILLRIEQADGDEASVQSIAREIIARWPASPQAAAARRVGGSAGAR